MRSALRGAAVPRTRYEGYVSCTDAYSCTGRGRGDCRLYVFHVSICVCRVYSVALVYYVLRGCSPCTPMGMYVSGPEQAIF